MFEVEAPSTAVASCADHCRAIALKRGTDIAFKIEDEAVHEAIKRIAKITGESEAQALATAVGERLARLQGDDLASRLLAIGHKTASRMESRTKPLGHGELLYDERGLPK